MNFHSEAFQKGLKISYTINSGGPRSEYELPEKDSGVWEIAMK